VESGANPNAVSPAGAQGLMQIMPGTARGLGLSNPFDPTANVEAGTRYITQLVEQFGSLEAGLAAYNWGPGNYQKVLAGQKAMPLETQRYVGSVMGGIGYSSGVFSGVGQGAAAGPASPVSNAPSNENLAALDKWAESQAKINDALRK